MTTKKSAYPFGNLKQTVRRTGLTRWQLVYLEERRLISEVERYDRRRMYSEDQIEMLEDLALIREALALTLDEAADVAGELRGGEGRLDLDRLDDVAAAAVKASERQAKLAQRLVQLARKRRRAMP